MGGGLSGGLDLNGRALEIADRMATNAEALRVTLRTLPGGARVIDAGIETPGGYAAGLALSEICMGGLGHVDYAPVVIGDNHWAGVRVWTDHPAVSCMASQYAGWAIQVGKYFAMGSGPLPSLGGGTRSALPTRGKLHGVPVPIVKYSRPWIAQPAYWDAARPRAR